MEESDLEKIIIKTDRLDDCAICLNRIGRRDIGTLQCGHSFHWSCCKKLFLENNYVSCPLCRKAILKRTSSDERINMEIERRNRENQRETQINVRVCGRFYNHDICMVVLSRFLFILNICLSLYCQISLINTYSSNMTTVWIVVLNFITYIISMILLSIKKINEHICYKRE